MRKSHRTLLSFLGAALLAACCGGVAAVNAWQQKQQETKPKPTPATTEDEPVAITKKTPTPEAVPTPRVPGPDEFSNFRYPVINSKGEIAFIGLFTAPGTPQGYGQAVFQRSAEGVWKFTREGEKITNLADELTGITNLAINEAGELTFVGTLAGKAPLPQVSSSLDVAQYVGRGQGLFYKTAAGLKMLLRLGEEVPNMPSFFSGIANSSSNTKGVTAFIGTYTDPDGKGLFIHEQGKLNLIARSGQKIGNGEEGVFSEHYYPSHINERGEIAWFSRVGSGGGIFVLRPKGIELIAFQGRPTAVKEANYIGFGQRAPDINDNGDVVFSAFFDGPNNGRGLFLKKANGPVEMIYRSGETIPGTNYNFFDFSSPMINNRGEIAFVGQFPGRSRGLFIKTAKGLETVTLTDQKLPGGRPDEIFNNFVQMSFNDRSQLVFYGQYRNAEVGVFIKDEKGLRALARRGDKMPPLK
ncbi:MAG: hypothetical protein HYR56_11890 [Acidobacteria bacterium]|nr:hypothetical protein [Acidobacteriota bacterium]MBI3428083.1 hypothetical protein [Acidobacteriota bacterium]